MLTLGLLGEMRVLMMIANKMSRIMEWLKGCGALVVCFALLTCFSTSSRACFPPIIGSLAGVTNLTNGGSVNLSALNYATLSAQVGDKLFSDFSFGYTDSDANSGDDLTASALVLSALDNQVGFGLRFQLPLMATGSTVKDIALWFSVTVLDPNELISGVHLDFTGSASGQGIALIDESISTNGFGTGTGLIGVLHVQNGNSPTVYEDSAFFAVPQHKIWIQKDIIVNANGFSPTTDWAHISIIDQTISQVLVPEPSTMALSVIGVAMCLIARRRR